MKKQIIVTTSWDDGHILDLRLASLLKKYDIAGTFYIAPKNSEFLKSKLLKASDILNLSKDFEIGAHTMTHPKLTEIDQESSLNEIVESKEYLERITKKSVKSFCYPAGKYTKKIKNQVKKAGFLFGRTTKQMATSYPTDSLQAETTLQVFPLSFRCICGELKFAIKKNPKLIPLLFTNDWATVATKTFDYVYKNGGIWHLWGHSWEVDKSGDWDRLEAVLKYVSQKDEVQYMTNIEALCHQKKLCK